MISIYCIEDINDMKYIGSTKQPLNNRLSGHKTDKRGGIIYCSSSKLHLEHSIIYELERCHEHERTERERYWINEIDCVNIIKLHLDTKISHKQFRLRNKDKLYDYQREYRQRMRIYKFLKMLEEY